MHEILKIAEASDKVARICELTQGKGATVYLSGIVGGAFSFYAASTISSSCGVHVLVAEDRDAAAYLLNDMYALLGEQDVLFFPSSYKSSISYDREEPECVVMRTNVANRIRTRAVGETLVVCTYPEALCEKTIARDALASDMVSIRVGERMEQQTLEEIVLSLGFQKVDFVYEPGQYSIRGGIFDIFSFAESRPYRIDFFGDEVESLRQFDIASQRSCERQESIDIIANTSCRDVGKVSFAGFAAEAVYWIHDAQFALQRIDEVRRKVLASSDEPSAVDSRLTSRRQILEDMRDSVLVTAHNTVEERPASFTVNFSTSPQPRFNKNFRLLAEDVCQYREHGFRCCILTTNRAQVERLDSIFHDLGVENASMEMLRLVLHEGFVDSDLKVCLYTDHQIFERYQRYRIRGEIRHDEQMTIAELNSLKIGDYVVHMDHGVGRFGGLVKIDENGKRHEAIKLIYKDGDVLFVKVHAMNRISKYRSADAEPPRIYKLGGSSWQKLKNATKKAVKDISRELIALYAKRKATPGFAFSADNYLQHELEASFEFEDTPDQQKAVEAVKKDMESSRPMDRLICGDVGFGKTEVAIRAAFKAAVDGKQTAVLVPTTILALQHYRSFHSRLADFPVRVEYLNRSRSARETRQIADDLASGRIDILIGTHKMLGKGIEFHDLGLLVIDEEQRFGVAAKERLAQKSVSVDTLTLTATPIPRTLQFSLLGSRDLSVISTPPPNRRPIVTESHAFSEELVRDAISAEMERGGQVYFIHNNVSELDAMRDMILRVCPNARVAVAHGKMNSEEMEKTLMDFIYADSDVLVATSIIESGIDIPNVNTIIINNADRFGLSNLHQLRGRVGRSDRRAYCYLLSRPDELLGSDARRRLRAIEEFSELGSGFNIAMQDLDIRGAGNLLGAEQSGFISDLGFETYRKILDEAVAELRAEGLDVSEFTKEELSVVDEMHFVEDTQVELGDAAEIPDDYVRQQVERLKLYKELDSLKDDGEMERFRAMLEDRFGPVPQSVGNLMQVIRLKWETVRLGIEKAKVKNGLMIVEFVSAEGSSFYQSDVFHHVLEHVVANPDRFVLKQRDGGKLAVTVRSVQDVASAVDILKSLQNR